MAIRQRFMLAFMVWAAIVNAYQLRVCLNVAITEMVTYKPKPEGEHGTEYCNYTEPKPVEHSHGTFDWSEKDQGLILSAFYWGYIITHLPGGVLADEFGGKYTLGIGIIATCIFTFLLPVAANAGFWYLVVTRIVTGLGEGTTFPAVSNLLARWIPVEERSLVGSIVFSGSQIGTVCGTIITGLILHNVSGNWPLVFYTFGVIGSVWFITWLLLCYSSPQIHPWISNHEKEYLAHAIGTTRKVPPPPWKKILTNGPVWALVFAQIGHDWTFFTMVTDLPKYMKDVLKYNIKESGFLASVPYLVMWCCSVLSGFVADYIIKNQIMSVTVTRKTFTSIAHVGPSLGVMLASYAGCNRTLAVICFTLAMASMGTFYAGMKVNGLDLSPNYAGTIMAIVNGIGAMTGIFTPYLVGVLTPDRTLTQWQLVFWLCTLCNAITLVAYLIWGSGVVQDFNEIPPHTPEHLSEEERIARIAEAHGEPQPAVKEPAVKD